MKRLTLAFLMVTTLAAGRVDAQAVSATQVRKKTNGGLTGDTTNALAVGIYRGATPPGTPVTGQLWLDTSTTPAILKEYTGATWEAPVSSAAITQATLASFPAAPTDGQILWVRQTKRALIYDADDSTWYFLDSTKRPAESSYSLEVEGYPDTFIGSAPATSGVINAGGSVTDGTHVCAVSYYNAWGGETMVGAATAAITAGGGNNTIDLTFAANTTNSFGKRIWCSKANTVLPLYLITSFDDTTTAAYSVTIADNSFSGATPPDVDFSAPLPASFTAMNLDRTKGGCGSTGNSVVCTMYSGIAPGAGQWGMGAYYSTAVVTDWMASYRVKRLLHTFSNPPVNCNSAGGYQIYVGIATERIDVAGALSRGVETTRGNAACFLPLNTLGTMQPGAEYRGTGAGWSGSPSHAAPWPEIAATPFYVRLYQRGMGGQWAYAWGLSPDAINWNIMPLPTVSETQNTCLGMSCVATRLPYIGVPAYQNSDVAGPVVIEFDQFTWENI